MRIVLASESADDVDAVLRPVVDVIVEAQRRSGRAPGAVQDQHARQVESLRDEPSLRLALDGLPFRERPLRDEEDLPPVPQHQLVNPAHRARVERPQRRPEVRNALDRLPDGVLAPASIAPRFRLGRPGGRLPFLFLLGVARDVAAPATGARARRRAEEPDLVLPERAREIGEHAVHVETYTQRH